MFRNQLLKKRLIDINDNALRFEKKKKKCLTFRAARAHARAKFLRLRARALRARIRARDLGSDFYIYFPY